MSRGRELHGAKHLGSDSKVEPTVKRPTPTTVAGHVLTESPLASYQIFVRNAGAPHQYHPRHPGNRLCAADAGIDIGEVQKNITRTHVPVGRSPLVVPCIGN